MRTRRLIRHQCSTALLEYVWWPFVNLLYFLLISLHRSKPIRNSVFSFPPLLRFSVPRNDHWHSLSRHLHYRCSLSLSTSSSSLPSWLPRLTHRSILFLCFMFLCVWNSLLTSRSHSILGHKCVSLPLLEIIDFLSKLLGLFPTVSQGYSTVFEFLAHCSNEWNVCIRSISPLLVTEQLA